MQLSALLPSWKLALDAAGKSPKTISSYLDSAKRLEAYLTTEGLPLEPEGIRAFLVTERGVQRRRRQPSITTTSASTSTGC
jgi:hypothetical protein